MAKVSLKGLWKKEESDEKLREMLKLRGLDENSIDYVVRLTLFEEEVQCMIRYVRENPKATEEELEEEVLKLTRVVSKKLGMALWERDHYFG